MQYKNISPLAILLFVLVLIESYAHLYLLKENAVSATWWYLIAGVVISVLVMCKSSITSRPLCAAKVSISFPWYTIGVLLMGVIAIPYLADVFAATPLDYRQADMLPIMQVMGERFLNGSNPYSPIAEIWDGMQPIYLPCMWLPYLPAIAFDFDLRWIGVLFLVVGCALPAFKSQKALGLVATVLSLLPVGMLIYGLTVENSEFFSLTEEGLVVGFYLLLATAIFRNNFPLMVAGLTLCMMSRYSLVIWAVMWVLVVFFFEDKRKGVLLTVISGACALALLIMTRGIAYLEVFISLSGAYLEDIQSPDQRWKMEPVVKNSLGLAKFFVYENLPKLHSWFFAALIGLPAILFGLYTRIKDRVDRRFFLLGSLKMCLVGFYNLLIYPLSYLFYTSTFLSVVLLYFYLADNRTSN